ncbi:hypothetical protein [Desulfitobacterium hafniense]|uniref:hypothetical protein n=1 Tax=Desulfitobacterium hafniense TaxID=49338 RepID=UPI000366BAFC|nr:hypothetical protein [Desulfitobacterium hafniense]
MSLLVQARFFRLCRAAGGGMAGCFGWLPLDRMPRPTGLAGYPGRLMRNTLKMTPVSSAKIPEAVLKKRPGSVALRTKANGFSRGAVG